MAESERIAEIVYTIMDSNGTEHTVGKKTMTIEPLDGMWRECVCLFLVTAVQYLKENSETKDKPTFSDLYSFTRKAWGMEENELEAMFGSNDASVAYQCYMNFTQKSGKVVKSAIIAANTELERIFFDDEKKALLQQCFE